MAHAWVLRLAATSPDGPEPLSEPSTVDSARSALGSAATDWAVATAALVAATAIERVGAPHSRSLARSAARVCEACILDFLEALVDETEPTEPTMPAEARQGARDSVHTGVPLDRMLRTMWAAHLLTMDSLLSALEAQDGVEDPMLEARAVRRLSYRYLNALTDLFSAAYTAERQAWHGTLAAARRSLVERLLAGNPVPRRSADDTLGIPVGGHHLAAVVAATGVERRGPSDERLVGFVRDMAGAGAAAGTLVVEGSAPAALWVWFSWHERPDAEQIERMCARVADMTGAWIALGVVADGADGFRRSHENALDTLRVAEGLLGEPLGPDADRQPVQRYRDHAVLAMLTRDEERAMHFVRDTLGALAEPRPRARGIRHTLEVYLATGRSRSAAARMLHVAPGTVAYRVARAEELLGRPIDGMDRDVQLALEVFRTLSPR